MQQKPQKPTEFDRFSSRYAATVNDSISFSGLQVDFFVRAKAERLLELIQAHFGDPHPLSVLDVGCGVGSYHPLLQGEVAAISGVDVSAESLRLARDENPDVDYRSFDGNALPFADGSFDVAYAICVVHHVPLENRSSFLTEMTRVVRPGGLVVLFEHNPFNPATRFAVWKCPFDEDAVLLSRGSSYALLRAAGLKNVAGRYMLALPAIEGRLRRLDDALSALPLGAQYYALGVRP